MGFEEGKKRLAAAIIERSLNGKEFLTCRHLLNDSTPDFIKESIVVLAKKHLKAERPVSWNFHASIDFDNEDVKTASDKLMLALLKSVRLERKEIEKCIILSVTTHFDLLIHPFQTLERVYFKNGEAYDRNSFEKSLPKLGQNVPFVIKLVSEVRNSDYPQINLSNFRIICNRIRQNIYSPATDKYILEEFELLRSFLALDDTLGNGHVDAVYIEEFFKSRGLAEAAEYIQKKKTNGKTSWDREDIKDIYTFALNNADRCHIVSEIDLNNETTAPKIVFKDASVFVVKRHKIEHQPPGPYPSIYDYIDGKDWKNFVRKIFQRKESDFKGFLNKVDKVHKWRDAKQMIDWELERRHLDPYSKEAVRLGDLVFAKFFSNGRYYSM